MDYKKLSYNALQRVSVSTTWSSEAIDRVADYLKSELEEKITSDNNNYAKCELCGNKTRVIGYCKTKSCTLHRI